MTTKVKIITAITAGLIAMAPASVSAASFSDGVFSWPTDYKTEKQSQATSTFDGTVRNLDAKDADGDKAKPEKRK